MRTLSLRRIVLLGLLVTAPGVAVVALAFFAGAPWSIQALVGSISFAVGVSSAAASELVVLRIIDEINQRRPGRLASHPHWTIFALLRLFRDYRDTCPEGRLLPVYWRLIGLGALGMLGAMGAMFSFVLAG